MNKKVLITATVILVIIIAGYFLLMPKPEQPGPATANQQSKPKVIKIGAILPLTGDGAYYGESAKKGIELALDFYKNIDEKLVNKVSILFENSQMDAKTAILIYNKLVGINDVKAIIGPMASNVTLAVISSMRKKDNILIISPTSTAPKLRGIKPNFYRTCLSDEKEAGQMAIYLQKTKPKDTIINIFYINNDYGLALANQFSALYRNTYLIGYAPDQIDFRGIIQKMKKNQNGKYVIYIIGYNEQFVLLKQLRESETNIDIYATTMIEDERYIKTGLLNGITYTFRALNEKNEGLSAFFIKKYGKMPNFYTAAAFDATYALLESFSLFEKRKVDNLIQAPKLLDLEGATGKIKFDDKNDIIQHLQIRKIEQDEIKIIN